MKAGKLITLVVLGFLAWQHQAMLRDQLVLIRSLPDVTNTYMEMRNYRIRLARYKEENGGALPTNIRQWLDQHFETDRKARPSVDYFGEPYRLERPHMRTPVLRSCGPDRRCRTEDDLLMEV